jgi:hypothetical protein
VSNFLAIATVTEVLRQMLDAAVNTDVSGAKATAVKPTAVPSDGVGVNVYLYQVSPNGALRNADLPTRREDGTLIQRPRAALDLHYLLTFYGKESELEPQRVLGSAVRTLHTKPVLTHQMVRSTVASVGFLSASDLADEVEAVKFTPIPLSLEELSKLWSVFFQTPYTLSLAYQASVVLIEGRETSQAGLPVRERNLYVMPFRQPVIQQVMLQAGPNEPIVVGSTLVIRGLQLRGDVTRVRIAGVEVTPPEVSDTQISLALSSPPFLPDSLRAGVQGVQVVHQILVGTPPVPHRGVESNVVAFVLRQTITVPGATATNVDVQFNPPVGRKQRVVLLLNEFNPPADRPARAYSFEAPSRDLPAASQTTTSIAIPISGVSPGQYLVRVQVDGAESMLKVNAADQYFEPQVTIP